MAQIDLETEAALSQLKYDEISTIPGAEIAELIGDVLKLIGGPIGLVGGISNLALKIRRLAGAGYSSNLIYVVGAVRDDLNDLYNKQTKLRSRIESLPSDSKFVEAVGAITLRAMQTSVRARLKRLSRILVNGVREDDLEAEPLDDMMRAAVELKEADVSLLGKLYESQNPMLTAKNLNSLNWHGDVQQVWRDFVEKGGLNQEDHLNYRSSFARLEALGLVQEISNTGMYGVGQDLYALLMEGKRFYERLQEIGEQK
jgi:hypothetical protein